MYSKRQLKQMKNGLHPGGKKPGADQRARPENQWISRKYFCVPVIGLV